MDSASTPSSPTDEGLTPEGPPRTSPPSSGDAIPPEGSPSATPSSGHAPVAPGAPAGSVAPTHDAARRAFFRELGRSALTTVGQVAGIADVVGRGTTAAAAGLLGIDLREPPARTRPTTGTLTRTPPRPAPRPATDDQYRSPYRASEDVIVVLDQRTIPGSLDELTCRRGTDVAYYLRTGAVRGGPLMAQVAAYGLALTARERRAQPAPTRRTDLRRTRDSLIAARPSSRAVAWAVGRMAGVEERMGEEADGEALAEAMRGEADAIALRMQADLGVVADHLGTTLAAIHDGVADEAPARPLGVLVHGDPGALWGGLVGPAVAALTQLTQGGRPVRVVLTEGRPFMEGARLAAWELRQAGIAHQVVADAAVAWLLDRQPVDVVVVAAEAVAANGDTAALVGSRGIADLVGAARARASAVIGDRDPAASSAAAATVPRLIVLGTGTLIDPGAEDGRALHDEKRPIRELTSFLGSAAVQRTDAVNPAVDVIPADRIDALITEAGAIAPVTAAAVLEAARD